LGCDTGPTGLTTDKKKSCFEYCARRRGDGINPDRARKSNRVNPETGGSYKSLRKVEPQNLPRLKNTDQRGKNLMGGKHCKVGNNSNFGSILKSTWAKISKGVGKEKKSTERKAKIDQSKVYYVVKMNTGAGGMLNSDWAKKRGLDSPQVPISTKKNTEQGETKDGKPSTVGTSTTA